MTARGPAGAPERVTVRIDALAAGGDGVGRDPTGRAVFVARTAPGDEVVARVVEPHARWARAELVELIGPPSGRGRQEVARAIR
ncbi:MAG: TRAM domain-containing protein, partial [Myxococcales bacterium]|nr:TRAM domain-containing protein [Myxococcales bacterium]